MAHYAKLNNSTVEQVIVVHNNELLVDGVEVESKGAQFCQKLFGGEWLQCSYNNQIRKQFPSVGFTYNADADVFVAPQPFGSWTLDANHDWQPPTPKPEGNYVWFEPNQVWIEIVEP